MKKVILAMAMGLLVFSCGCKDSEYDDPATEVTEKDFKTDTERITFLQNLLPVRIPPEATAIKFRYVSWMDWNLKASFSLPAEAFELFTKSLTGLKSVGKNKFQFESKVKKSTGTIEIFPKTRCVRISCSNPPPE